MLFFKVIKKIIFKKFRVKIFCDMVKHVTRQCVQKNIANTTKYETKTYETNSIVSSRIYTSLQAVTSTLFSKPINGATHVIVGSS